MDRIVIIVFTIESMWEGAVQAVTLRWLFDTSGQGLYESKIEEDVGENR